MSKLLNKIGKNSKIAFRSKINSKTKNKVLEDFCKLIIKNNLPQVVLENASITFVEAKSDYSDLVGITLKASEERLKMGKNIRILGLDVEFVG